MLIVVREAPYHWRARQVGLVDEVGGASTVIVAILGLMGLYAPILVVIATILFGVTLLIHGNTMLSECARISLFVGPRSPVNAINASARSAVVLLGAGGIVLGVLALLDFNSAVLTPIASIMFGAALIFSSVSAWHLDVLRRASGSGEQTPRELVANQMTFDSISIQVFGALAAIVLGVLAVSGASNDLTFNLVALLVLGSALVLKGGSLNAILFSFMRSTS